MLSLLDASPESLEFRVLAPEVDGEQIWLHYRIERPETGEEIAFRESLVVPSLTAEHAESEIGQTLLRLLSLAGAPSYYKALIPSTIRVDFPLTPAERQLFTKIISHGLGEFAYRNDVPAALRPTIIAEDAPALTATPATEPTPQCLLVAVGGGKDSIVSIETLRELGIDSTLFSVNDYKPIADTEQVAKLPRIMARRKLDPQIMELNQAGALNGHVPVTAMNSVIAVLVAWVADLDGVAFSNEASSSFGNVHWHGIDINHQWSKGIDFETDLRAALPAGAPTYFSLLRPLTELAITRKFATLRQYHSVFTSCNRAFKLDPSQRTSWCGDCPKCRFVFLCLAPFVSRDHLLSIFGGRDLFADPAQREGFFDLLNIDDRMKPFECVGEPSECRVAVTLLSDHPDWSAHPFLADPQVRATFVGELDITDAFRFRGDNHVPPTLEERMRAIF